MSNETLVKGMSLMLKNVPIRGKVSDVVFNNIVWFLLIAMLIIMGTIDPVFFTGTILKNILVQASVLGVLTAGISFTLLVGEIDISVVGVLGFAAGLGTLLMSMGLNWLLAIITIVVTGVIVGLVNGLLVAYLKASSLIETLAMMLILQGALLAMTKGRSIINFPNQFTFIGQSSVLGIPIIIVVFIVLYWVLNLMWKKTVLGRSFFAVGGNASSANASGIKVNYVKTMAFVISGTLAGLAGFILSSYMGVVTDTFGSNYLMYTLAAAVIGGVSLTGGRGNVIGVLGGVILLTIIQVGLQVLGISSYYVTLVGGVMIFLAVLIDAIRIRVQG